MGGQLKQQGLTLIEVMVAILILSLVMVGVILSSSHVLRATDRLHDREMGLWAAQAVALEFTSGALGKVTERSNYSGEQVMGNKTWQWVAKAEPFQGVIRVNIAIVEAGHTEAIVTKAYYMSAP